MAAGEAASGAAGATSTGWLESGWLKGTIQRPRGAYIDRDVNLNSRPSDSS